MTSPAHDQFAPVRRRFGLSRVLIIAGILAFGGFVLLTDGRTTTADLLSGFNDVVSR